MQSDDYNDVTPDMSSDVSGSEEESEASDNPKEESDESLYLPESALGGRQCKPGDTITMKVIGKTSDGELQLAVDDKSTDKSYGSSDEADADDLRTALKQS